MKYVFRRGYCVRSSMFGFGQVLAEGETPLIRFLDGRECRVPADTLRFIPEEEFEAEIANRSVIEARLLIHVYGPEALDASGRLWVRDHDGFWTTTDKLSVGPQIQPEAPRHFSSDDVVVEYRVLNADGMAGRRDVIDCAITRLPGNHA